MEALKALPLQFTDEFISKLPDELPDDDRCKHCHGFGSIRTNNGVEACECVKLAMLHRRNTKLFGSEYGHKFKDIESIPNFVKTQSYQACLHVYDCILNNKLPNRQFYVLCGAHGRGKTHAAMALLYQLTDMQYPAYGFKFREVVAKHQKGIEGFNWLEAHYNRIDNASVVICEEAWNVEQTGNPEHVTKAVHSTFMPCYESNPQKILICTTNKTVKEIFDPEITPSFTSHMRDRFHMDNKCCGWIEEDGISFRRR